MNDTFNTLNADNDAKADLKHAYHTPEMREHGDLTQLTKGGGASSFDGVGYSSFG